MAIALHNNSPLKPFSVIGFYEESGQMFCHHVVSDNESNAFVLVANLFDDVMLICVLPKHVTEKDNDIQFAGESLVDADTVLSQPEVFGNGALGYVVLK